MNYKLELHVVRGLSLLVTSMTTLALLQIEKRCSMHVDKLLSCFPHQAKLSHGGCVSSHHRSPLLSAGHQGSALLFSTGHPAEAQAVFDEMVGQGLEPDHTACCLLVDAWLNSWSRGRERRSETLVKAQVGPLAAVQALHKGWYHGLPRMHIAVEARLWTYIGLYITQSCSALAAISHRISVIVSSSGSCQPPHLTHSE